MVVPGEAFDPAPCSRRSRPSAAPPSTACRRCSSPSSSRPTSSASTSPACARDDGRRALPGRGHEAGALAMHMDEVTIVCGMTETSPVSTQTRATSPSRSASRPSGAYTRTSRSRSSTRRPARRAARHARRAVHPRLQRHARLLGRRGGDGARDRRRRLDAHRRPRRHGRRRLRQHRRPDQGHDHPRRREHLPARDRGVPPRPPRGQRRPGHRRAQRALWRGGHGLGQAARRAQLTRRAERACAAGSPATRSPVTGSSSTPSP